MARRFVSPPAAGTHAVFREWYRERTGVDFTGDPSCTGLAMFEQDDEGQNTILAVVLFHSWTKHGVEASIASRGGDWLKEATTEIGEVNRLLLFTIYDYAFRVCDRSRITGFIAVTNTKSININDALGHTNEARIRDWFGDGNDAFIYGYTRREFDSSALKREFVNV